MGADGYFREPFNRNTCSTSTAHLLDHPAVTQHGRGVSTPDLCSFHEAFADYANSRVRTVGAAQYAQQQVQKFETYDIARTLDELLDELADAQVYLSFLAIKVIAATSKTRLLIGDNSE